MSNNLLIKITPEAKAILVAIKKEWQGYSKGLLASEAIKQAYGRRVAAVPHANAMQGDGETGILDTARQFLADNGGDTEAAIKQARRLIPDNKICARVIGRIRAEGGV